MTASQRHRVESDTGGPTATREHKEEVRVTLTLSRKVGPALTGREVVEIEAAAPSGVCTTPADVACSRGVPTAVPLREVHRVVAGTTAARTPTSSVPSTTP